MTKSARECGHINNIYEKIKYRNIT